MRVQFLRCRNKKLARHVSCTSSHTRVTLSLPRHLPAPGIEAAVSADHALDRGADRYPELDSIPILVSLLICPTPDSDGCTAFNSEQILIQVGSDSGLALFVEYDKARWWWRTDC
ncbi:hypothetical protein EVAR_86090_1 [Eumeta japonica]|uniref:Uncharacterized protein n=1 Tax=Eumeta variegata TaxID=151549 RepID=A0A4C1V0I4_EUMVA|nr:hypothetical protein EVAR_86090_1 [Eumeta japonica]